MDTHTMTQNEAVYFAVTATFTNTEVVPPTSTWSNAQKEQVHGLLLKMFKAGEWTKNSGGQDDASVMKYIPGLVNNHVRKDLRLNGGKKYEAKNPGSRAGSSDATIQAMRGLLEITEDEAARVAIQAEIDKRLQSLKPKVKINIDNLPESLRHLVSQS